MLDLSFINLYVGDMAVSTSFYKILLGVEPNPIGPAYMMFATKSGVTLALWERAKVEPAADVGEGGACEVCFTVEDTDAVYGDWAAHDVKFVQPPTTSSFGRTFVALDPDGHRLRVFTPPAQ